MEAITEINKTEIFEAKADIAANEPTFDVIKDKEGNIIDYQNVRIEGYANTFELDRGNDQTIPGAFLEHLGEYRENPILLLDHDRSTSSAIGKVFSAFEDEKGLKVSAILSNSPSAKDVRYKVAEGILRTFSIGGLFHMVQGKEKNVITKVELREISIVTVPMNQSSLFEVKQDASDNQNLNDCESENMTNNQTDGGLTESGVYLLYKGEKLKIKK